MNREEQWIKAKQLQRLSDDALYIVRDQFLPAGLDMVSITRHIERVHELAKEMEDAQGT